MQAARYRFRPGAVILMYHRVAELENDPWSMAVSPDHFAQHLDILRLWTRPMSLDHMATLAAEGRLPERAVSITFDDGYVDNFTHAMPRLAERDLRATVFVTAASERSISEFWWDRLQSIVMSSLELPTQLDLDVQDGHFHWEAEAGLDVDTQRSRLYHDLWHRLQQRSHDERTSLLEVLAEWAGAPPDRDTMSRPMTDEELRDLAHSGCIDIGAHTVTHSLLPALSPDDQNREIVDSKCHLERIIGQCVTSFSFPFGADGTPAQPLQPLVREAGFSSACTSEPRTMRGIQDPFHLPRYVVEDWPGPTFAQHLTRWFMN
jgi:peptidoglycan/xylan/chitin deacetylase (PgdA/CDA1 family)